ncbi:MAG: undecaprenyl-phosphate glucose phosphotransferase [Roseiarcus sp.]
MALYSVDQARSGGAVRKAGAKDPRAARAAKLEQLEQEGCFARFPREVMIGLVRFSEFALIALAGFGLEGRLMVPRAVADYLLAALVIGVSLASVAGFQAVKVYSNGAFRRPIASTSRTWGALGALFLSLLAAARLGHVDTPAARLWLSAWFWLALGLITFERLGLAAYVAHLSRTGRLERRAALIGGGPDCVAGLMRDLDQAGRADVRIVGIFDDRDDDRAPAPPDGPPKLGNVDDLVEFARRARIDLVIFVLPVSAERRILEMLGKLWVLPIDIRLAANASRLRLASRSYSYLGGAAMLDLTDKPLGDWDVALKAAFDRIVGAALLIALSPVMTAAAIAVKLDSRGPILFRQLRYGFNNELVSVLKFRTLRHDSADLTAEKLVTPGDRRVTRIGHFLRCTSIDELPQLINVVFSGDLSLVGPRPHAIHAKAANRLYDEVVENYFARHRVKPGITGWAQINGWRGVTETPEQIQRRVDADLYYIENWSLAFDLYILMKTPWALLRNRSAF